MLLSPLLVLAGLVKYLVWYRRVGQHGRKKWKRMSLYYEEKRTTDHGPTTHTSQNNGPKIVKI